MSDNRPILCAEALSKGFRVGALWVQALDKVSFSVLPGRVTGLIGPDAAGKTTLMRLSAGLLIPDSGRIEALGLDATQDALAVQSSLGYMPQRFGLYEDLTVQENLDLYADLQGVAKTSRPARYAELMHMTGLAPFTGRLARRLSGGMKQKLGLACTLVRPPRLLLLDEPTVGVDPVSRRELWAIVDRLVQEKGMSVLLSTAYLDEAERCQEVILLHNGRILDQGSPQTMSRRMDGRSWSFAMPGRKPRDVQSLLAQSPGVLDALVQGATVRVVSQNGWQQEQLQTMPGMEESQITPLPARFEDVFIDLLRQDPAAHAVTGDIDWQAATATGHQGPVIEVDKLERRFGAFRAVDGISFVVNRGEIFGLLGANGAGKSTTFRMLCGLLPPSAGSLRVAGLDLRHAAAAARGRIGYMSQKFSLYGNLTIRQNLVFFASAYGLEGKARQARIDWALSEFDLGRYADQLAGDLPLGFKQRLAMACALMHHPEILFLDEPTSGVDPLARREFWQRINALARAGVTVLVTTHFMEEAEYCDRLAIMAAGRILAMDEPAAVKAACATPAQPDPSMEDAFIALVQAAETHKEAV